MKPASVIAPIKGIFTRKSDGYTAIPAPVSHDEARKQQADHKLKQRKLKKLSIGGLVLCAILFLVVVHLRPSAPKCVKDGSCDTDTSHLWGQYSPFFSVPSELQQHHVKGCRVNTVQVLSRHGARFPTLSRTKVYKDLIDKIHKETTEYAEGFEWLKDFEYKLKAEELTPHGQDQMYASGRAFWRRYKFLIKEYDPFVRSSGAGRVLDSAKLFMRSYIEVQGRRAEDEYEKILQVPEGEGWNNTMTHYSCPAFEHGPAAEVMHPKQNEWKEIFVPSITKRLNQKLLGANLTIDDTIAFMDQCPYHSYAQKDFELSRFCQLFSPDEWKSYDYYQTLDKWYAYGPGNPLAPTQGVGYVNELIARLTGEPVDDHTSSNQTLSSSPKTFPLGSILYADFSHDNGIITIMSALGLYNETEQLPTTHRLSPEETKGFSSAWTVPMSGRMYIEKMACGKGGNKEDYVRVLVNDRVMPLKTCDGDEYGRCRLSKFIDSLSFARNGGLWDECPYKKDE